MFRLRFPTVVEPLPRGDEGAAPPESGAAPPSANPTSDASAGLLTGETGSQPPAAVADGSGDGFQIPEKFLVKGDDGKENWEAIARKALPAYANLEKRFGGGEAPPETPDKYKIDNYLPEGFERNPESEKGILSRLHEMKLNNAQAQGVLSYFGELLGTSVSQEKAGMETAMATLKSAWGADYEANMGRANFALTALGDEATVQEITSDPKLMNNPALIRILAKMGSELEDDKSVNELNAGEIESIDQLRRSAAYLDDKHPDHKRTVAKVNAAYSRGYKDKH